MRLHLKTKTKQQEQKTPAHNMQEPSQPKTCSYQLRKQLANRKKLSKQIATDKKEKLKQVARERKGVATVSRRKGKPEEVAVTMTT